MTKARLQKDCQAQDNLGLSVYGFGKKGSNYCRTQRGAQGIKFQTWLMSPHIFVAFQNVRASALKMWQIVDFYLFAQQNNGRSTPCPRSKCTKSKVRGKTIHFFCISLILHILSSKVSKPKSSCVKLLRHIEPRGA